MNRRSFNLRLLTSCLLILAPAKLFASTHPWFDKSKQYSGLFPYYHVDKWTLHKPLYLVTDKKIFIEIFSLCVRNSRQTIPAEFHEHIEYFHLPSVESRDDPLRQTGYLGWRYAKNSTGNYAQFAKHIEDFELDIWA